MKNNKITFVVLNEIKSKSNSKNKKGVNVYGVCNNEMREDEERGLM